MTDVEEVLRDELRRLETRCGEIRELLSDIQWKRYNREHGVHASTAVVVRPWTKQPRKPAISNVDLNGTARYLHKASVVGA
jgi:hypothetical protein